MVSLRTISTATHFQHFSEIITIIVAWLCGRRFGFQLGVPRELPYCFQRSASRELTHKPILLNLAWSSYKKAEQTCKIWGEAVLGALCFILSLNSSGHSTNSVQRQKTTERVGELETFWSASVNLLGSCK